MKTRLLLLSVFVCLTLAFSAAADSLFEIRADGTLTAYSGSDTDIVLPDTVDGVTVREVGSRFYKSLPAETVSITLGANVEVLGINAIRDLASLRTVNLNEGLRRIDASNFYKCAALEEVVIPASVTSIDNAFTWCPSLRRITFLGVCPEFTSPSFVFGNASKELVIQVPDDQVDAYKAALRDAVRADRITGSGAAARQTAASAGPNVDDLYEIQEGGALRRYLGTDTEIVLPDRVRGLDVVSLADSFSWKNIQDITAVTFNPGLKKLGIGVISRMPLLKTLQMNEGLTEIGANNVYQLDALTEVTVPASVQKIGAAFLNCGALSRITFLGPCPKITSSFAFSGLSEDLFVTVPAGMGEEYREALKKHILPERIREVGQEDPEPAPEQTEAPEATDAPERTEAPKAADLPEETDDTDEIEIPEDFDPALIPYVGVWHCIYMQTAYQQGDPRDMGLDVTLTLRPDMTGELDFMGSDGGKLWGPDERTDRIVYGPGTRMSVPLIPEEDGTLRYGESRQNMLLFRRDKDAPGATAAPFPTPEVTAAPPVQPEVSPAPTLLPEVRQAPEAEPVTAPQPEDTPDQADSIDEIEIPEGFDPALVPYVGVWHCIYMQTAYQQGDPRDMGLDVTLTLRPDMTGELDFMGSDGGKSWGPDERTGRIVYGPGTRMSVPLIPEKDGTLRYGESRQNMLLFSRDKDAPRVAPAMTPVITPAPTQAPAPDDGPQQNSVPAPTDSALDRRYVCTRIETATGELSPKSMPGEYAIEFMSDGTAAFTAAGITLPGLVWTLDGDDYVIDYFGQADLRFIPAGDGFTLDYLGAFMMTFSPDPA